MKNQLRITFDSNDNCEVEIHSLSGAELIIAINELIISVKKCYEKCGVSKNSKILNRHIQTAVDRHIQTAVDRALNGEHFTSEEDVATEMLKDAFKELINDLEVKSKHETEKGEKDEKDEE